MAGAIVRHLKWFACRNGISLMQRCFCLPQSPVKAVGKKRGIKPAVSYSFSEQKWKRVSWTLTEFVFKLWSSGSSWDSINKNDAREGFCC